MKMRTGLWQLIRFVITITLMVLLIQRVQWDHLQLIATRLSWVGLAGAAWLLLIGHGMNVARWWLLVQTNVVSYKRLFVYYCASLFANNFLPTGIGGDGVRVALLSRDVSLARAGFSVGLDRVMGFASFSAIGVLGLWLGLPPSVVVADLTSISSSVALAISAGVILAGIVSARFLLRLPRIIEWRERLGHYTHTTNWRVLLGSAYALSFAANMSIVISNWIIIQAIGVPVPFQAAIWMFLASWLSLLLPIAVNGLGLVEGGIVTVLALYGVPATNSFGIALLNRLLMIIFSLLGGLVSLKWNSHKSLGRSM